MIHRNHIISDFLENVTYQAYKFNNAYTIRFNTFKECQTWIDENLDPCLGYKPEIAWEKGVGDYDTNWSSLMKAVEQIFSMDHVYEPHDKVFFRTFGMRNEETGEFMVRIDRHQLYQGESLILTTHEAVCGFIERLNENK